MRLSLQYPTTPRLTVMSKEESYSHLASKLSHPQSDSKRRQPTQDLDGAVAVATREVHAVVCMRFKKSVWTGFKKRFAIGQPINGNVVPAAVIIHAYLILCVLIMDRYCLFGRANGEIQAPAPPTQYIISRVTIA
jgi:hypothetical protein